MWNRVFLLASGFLFGWTLASYWAVPAARVGIEARRMGLGLLVGVAVVVLLALASPQAAAAGAIVWAFGALVAYAGNARQMGRAPTATPIPFPTPTGSDVGRTAVVLVSAVEPAHYDGPAYWAWCLQRREDAGGEAPHWFVRPRRYARIRSAYSVRASAGTASDPLERLAVRLRAALGEAYRVETARIGTPPPVATTLATLANDGIPRIVVQPLDLEPDALDALRAAITASRVREAGVRAEVRESLSIPAWADDEGRLDAWIAGIAPEPLPDPDAQVLSSLQSRVMVPEH